MPKTKNTATRSRRAAAPKKPPQPGAELTEFQQLVCNLAADLILNGGRKADTEQLVKATLGHSFLRFQDHDAWLDDGKFLNRELPRWLHKLSRHWPKKRAPAPEQAPQTVSEMARHNLRDTLRERFEEFLGRARMHELYLLEAVLETFESNADSTHESAECALAEAFMYELGSDCTYVKVSRDQVEVVEEYIAGLHSVPDDEEKELAELTRLWRQDHPEPMSGSSARPNGHLGRKDDDDEESHAS